MDGFFSTVLGKIVLSGAALVPFIIAIANWYDAKSNLSWDESAKFTKPISGTIAGVLVILWIAFMSWLWK